MEATWISDWCDNSNTHNNNEFFSASPGLRPHIRMEVFLTTYLPLDPKDQEIFPHLRTGLFLVNHRQGCTWNKRGLRFAHYLPRCVHSAAAAAAPSNSRALCSRYRGSIIYFVCANASYLWVIHMGVIAAHTSCCLAFFHAHVRMYVGW